MREVVHRPAFIRPGPVAQEMAADLRGYVTKAAVYLYQLTIRDAEDVLVASMKRWVFEFGI